MPAETGHGWRGRGHVLEVLREASVDKRSFGHSPVSMPNGPWTDQENGLIVADCFAALGETPFLVAPAPRPNIVLRAWPVNTAVPSAC